MLLESARRGCAVGSRSLRVGDLDGYLSSVDLPQVRRGAGRELAPTRTDMLSTDSAKCRRSAAAASTSPAAPPRPPAPPRLVPVTQPLTPAASSRFGPSAAPGPDSAGLNESAVQRVLGLERTDAGGLTLTLTAHQAMPFAGAIGHRRTVDERCLATPSWRASQRCRGDPGMLYRP